MFRFLPAITISFLCGFVLCVSIPQITYFQNVNEFSFDHFALFNAMLFPFIGIALATFLLQLLAMRIFPMKEKMNPFQIVILAMMSLLLIEGLVVSYRLPEMDGGEAIYGSSKRTIASMCAWGIGLTLAVWRWRWFARRLYLICGTIFLVFVSILGDAVINMKDKLPITNTLNSVHDNLAFHPKTNVIAICVDSLPTFAVEEVLEQKFELKRTFENFILFRNNLGPGRVTSWAIPAILQGSLFSGDLASYNNNSFDSPRSFFQMFSNAGYDVYISSGMPFYNRIHRNGLLSTEENTDSFAAISSALYIQLSFRFIPYFLKNYFYEAHITSALSQIDLGNLNQEFIPEPFFEKILSRIDKISLTPTAHFHTYIGAHMPFLRTKTGHELPPEFHYSKEGLMITAEYVLNNLAVFIDKLKQAGIYESSSIVFFGDHGDHLAGRRYSNTIASFNAPAFMLKPSGAKFDFAYSNAPMSSIYLGDVLYKLHQGIPLESVLEGLPAERRFIPMHEDIILSSSGIDLDKMTFTEEPIVFSGNSSGILTPGNEYALNITDIGDASPIHLKNAHFQHGWAMTLDKQKANEFWWKVKTLKDSASVDLEFTVTPSRNPSPRELSLLIENMASGETIFKTTSVPIVFAQNDGDGKAVVSLPKVLLDSEKNLKLSTSLSEEGLDWVHITKISIKE